MSQLAVAGASQVAAQRPRSTLLSHLERTVPRGGASDHFAHYFSEVTLDVVEEATFKKRRQEEAGPRLVHLRQNCVGEITIPPHIELNVNRAMGCQLWTGHPKVDRSLYIIDRQHESLRKTTAELVFQKQVPALRSSFDRKNFGTKLGSRPLADSFRAGILNSSRRTPLQIAGE
mmetsp:Transcript_61789/g.133911  ORF Transcript_61789/g.133911 Transcript_61789/m.133911 type:complete len:174 (+) Transcript_61789:31-552(+)